MIYLYIIIPIIIIGIPITLLIYLTITEYKPDAIEDSKLIKNSKSVKSKTKMTLTTLNTGYSSLDEKQDFFVEGGKGSRCISKAKTLVNLTSIVKLLKEFNSDFYFLQEVDEPCRRSCLTNQVKYITKKFHDYNSSFAYNYKVNYVPIPLFKPMGSALSGLISLSKERIISSKRYQLKGDEKYPKRVFFLKRCMMINKYKIGKQELTLINIHLSAYDKGGLIRKKQIDHLIEFIKEYSKENKHVIIGGDWNHLLDSTLYKSTMPEWVGLLPENLLDTSYRMIYDNSVNTVRSEDKPYIKGENFETVIDGFLVSPGIEVLNIQGSNYGFRYTDHNPVTLTFRLK